MIKPTDQALEKFKELNKLIETQYNVKIKSLANTANKLRNYSPTKLKEKSPEEEFTGKIPNLSNIKIFGSRVLIKDKSYKKKLDDKTREGLMLGYNEENDTYKVWDIERKEAVSTRDITIFEEIFLGIQI